MTTTMILGNRTKGRNTSGQSLVAQVNTLTLALAALAGLIPFSDPKTETRLPLLSLDIYVPRDERFGHLKMSDFLGYALKAIVQSLLPTLEALADMSPFEFDTFQDVLNLYEGGIELPDIPEINEIKDGIPLEMIKELVRSDGEHLLKLPLPQVIQSMLFRFLHIWLTCMN